MYALWRGSANWNPTVRLWVWWANFVFVLGFTKTVKLWGLFRRNPSDILYLPLSIVFGWFHGLIKLYALFTLNMVRYRPPGPSKVQSRRVCHVCMCVSNW